jgi:hypothetical protein
MEIRTMKTIPPPEIDTKSDDKAHRQGEFHSISSSGISVRDADTPKHCNKGERGMAYIVCCMLIMPAVFMS